MNKALLGGKVAIINGAATGMGRSTAILFSAEGCNCVIADINEKDGKKTAEEASAKGKECVFFNCDLTNLQQIKDCVDFTARKFGTVDILVGCAGGTIPREKVVSSPPGETAKPGIAHIDERYYDLMMALNLKGHVFFAREVAPYMIKQNSGKMVFVSSLGVYSPPGPSSEYHGAKAGLIGLTINLAYELAPRHINVNAILPGPVKTPFWDPVLTAVPVEKRNEVMDNLGKHGTPLGRIGLPEDIANCALFLCSELSSFITGETINVGGGVPLNIYHEGKPMVSYPAGEK
ncbi:MAG: SDR family oxidoreductase [Dehalococcoidales bacterium]|nr:SDR family oxidoreductase [Dehalococcoidales bacterium]